MSMLGVDRAIRARLRGEPCDAAGRSIAKEGIIVPIFQKGQDPIAAEGTWDHTKLSGGYRQIPVFRYKEKGQPWATTTPCIVYRRIGFEYDAGQSPVQSYKPRGVTSDHAIARQIKVGSHGPTVEILDRAGTVVASGPQFNDMRDPPDSYTYMYQFDIYAESDIERDLILEAFVDVFPSSGFLEYKQNDESMLTVDMVQEDITDLDELEGELTDRQASHTSLTYRVEAFRDTTLTNTILEGVNEATLYVIGSLDQEDTEETVPARSSQVNNPTEVGDSNE